MELVGNVKPLDRGNHLATIAWLRSFADQLEKDEVPRLEFGCLVAYDVGGGLLTSTLGEPGDYFRLLGLLDMGKLRLADILMG